MVLVDNNFFFRFHFNIQFLPLRSMDDKAEEDQKFTISQAILIISQKVLTFYSLKQYSDFFQEKVWN